MNNAVFNKTQNYLVTEPNDHTTTFFTEKLLATEMKENRDTYE